MHDSAGPRGVSTTAVVTSNVYVLDAVACVSRCCSSAGTVYVLLQVYFAQDMTACTSYHTRVPVFREAYR